MHFPYSDRRGRNSESIRNDYLYDSFGTGGGIFENPKINLILNFDVNKTLIAIDPVQNKGVDEVLKGSLTLILKANWKEKGVEQVDEPINYETYLKDVLNVSKNDRRKYVLNFFEYLENEHPDIYVDAKSQYDKAMKTYEEMQRNHRQIFESFYRLIEYLNNRKYINYQIVVRTFGQDIPEIAEEIHQQLDIELEFAKFKQGHLLVKTPDSDPAEFLSDNDNEDDVEINIKNKAKIFEWIKDFPGHLAIKDDWKYWNSHKERQQYGKLFVFAPYDPNEDIPTMSIFFDDNITVDPPNSATNIVAPFDVVKNENVAIPEVIDRGLVYQVDTLQALGDVNYYINLVNNSIVLNVMDKKPGCQYSQLVAK